MADKAKSLRPQSSDVNIESVHSLTINITSSRIPFRRPNLGQSFTTTTQQRFVRGLNLVSKIISVAGGVAVTSFATMALLGYQQVAGLQIDSLLTIVSITFVGGIISIGGITIFSLQTNLRRQQRLLQALQPHRDFKIRFHASLKLSQGWHHYSFPSRNLILVYGHEREARLYKTGTKPSCLWKYGDGADFPIHFAQSAARYGDHLFALGDYATGVVTVFDLRTMSPLSLQALQSGIKHLEFSPNGQYLLVTPSTNNSNCTIINLQTYDIISVQSSGSAVWLSNEKVLFISDNKTLNMYDINMRATTKLHDSYCSIVQVAAGAAGIAFAEESNGRTELSLSDSDKFYPISIGDITASVKHLQVIGDVLLVATSDRSHSTDANRLRVIDRDGHVLSEVHYNSCGDYPKYSFATIADITWFCTTGVNRIIRLFSPGRSSVKLDLRTDDTKVNPEAWIASVQLTPVSEQSTELSIFCSAGQMVLFRLDTAQEDLQDTD